MGSCYCTFPMTKTICTCLSLQSVFLYQLQPHSQHQYNIIFNNSKQSLANFPAFAESLFDQWIIAAWPISNSRLFSHWGVKNINVKLVQAPQGWMVEGLSEALVHCTLSSLCSLCIANLVVSKCKVCTCIWTFRSVCMLVLYQAMPLMPHKDVILCLVVSRYIQWKLGMALSTIALTATSLLTKHRELLVTCARILPNILDTVS